MCKLNKKSGLKRIDPCMRNLIEFIEENNNLIEILACCCGHKKYNMTIVVFMEGCLHPYDLFTGKQIPRKKRFYKKDKQGYYYIPEVSKVK
tara:strand:+ start:5350 stop:5622 length:273 start_codon:yes stop_codon:yes gene_type:complete